jgi:hypothetical protein
MKNPEAPDPVMGAKRYKKNAEFFMRISNQLKKFHKMSPKITAEQMNLRNWIK